MRRRAALLLVLVVVAACESRQETPEQLLAAAWRAYKERYVTPEGYVLDATRGDGEAISEGQGYALLRAAWSCDEPTFDRVLRWTEATLARDDHLFSWRWSARERRVLDRNTATDGDQEIAYALILAAHGFGRPELELRAREIVRAIRAREAIEVPGGWFPAAGDWAVAERIVNLSYFLPYAYPEFARIDPDGRWDEATATGYALIGRVLAEPGRKLVPDFMVVAPDGAIRPLPEHSELGRDFSFDAMRLYFRVALDCALHRRPLACDGPLRVEPLVALLRRDGVLFTRYATSGRPLSADESLSFYGGVLPFLVQHAPAEAAQLRAGKLAPARLRPVLESSDRYYDLNWIWFGIAAAEGLLVDRDGLRCAAVGSPAAGSTRF